MLCIRISSRHSKILVGRMMQSKGGLGYCNSVLDQECGCLLVFNEPEANVSSILLAVLLSVYVFYWWSIVQLSMSNCHLSSIIMDKVGWMTQQRGSLLGKWTENNRWWCWVQLLWVLIGTVLSIAVLDQLYVPCFVFDHQLNIDVVHCVIANWFELGFFRLVN